MAYLLEDFFTFGVLAFAHVQRSGESELNRKFVGWRRDTGQSILVLQSNTASLVKHMEMSVRDQNFPRRLSAPPGTVSPVSKHKRRYSQLL